jgi:hypothetical protein
VPSRFLSTTRPYLLIPSFIETTDTMACKMNCTLKGDDPKETMEALIKMAESQGFVFKGTSTKGTFEYAKTLKARGEYSRSKKKVILTVTKYPFLSIVK